MWKPLLALIALAFGVVGLLVMGHQEQLKKEKEAETLGFEIRDTLVEMGRKTSLDGVESIESLVNTDGSIEPGFHLFKRSESNVVDDNMQTICYTTRDTWYISVDTPDGRLSFPKEVAYDDCQSPLEHLRRPVFLGGYIEKQLIYLRLIKTQLGGSHSHP